MPIVDILLVIPATQRIDPELSIKIADELGKVLDVTAGRLWVRLQTLPREQYAENNVVTHDGDLPVFVTILLANPPIGSQRETQAHTICHAVAKVIRHPPERVHVEYAPPGAGRIAFGGRLVT